jgi:HEAT repeat protein
MDNLAEGEVNPRGPAAAPAYAVQFFLIPLAVVAVTVVLYLGFRSLVTDERSAQDYLMEIRTGGASRRWPAAYELSRLMADPDVARDADFGPALVEAFVASKDDDPRVRQYLAMTMGRLVAPLPAGAVPALVEALGDADSQTVISTIWALGSLGDPSVIPVFERMYGSSDAGVRKMTVYALGALPAAGGDRVLATALNDVAVDVQWNAAIALARHGNPSAVPVLRRMLDRAYVTEAVDRQRALERSAAESGAVAVAPGGADGDPVGAVMISALQAVSVLRAAALQETVADLSRDEPNLRVRQAAMEALKVLRAV